MSLLHQDTRRAAHDDAEQHPPRHAVDMALADDHRIDTITQPALAGLLAEYPSFIPPRAADYEEARYATIPQAVSDRRQDDKPALEHSEVVALVGWKLSHGTFRPKLKQLVQSNSPELVRDATATAFARYDGNPESAKSCLTDLCVLKGIGSATASLLLSVAFPDSAPFFSDELFRWAFWESGKGKGWDRPIKYTPKEYLLLSEKVKQLRQQHGWTAVMIEKAAFALGRRALHKNADQNNGKVEEPRRFVVDDTRPTKRPKLESNDAVPQSAKRVKKDVTQDSAAAEGVPVRKADKKFPTSAGTRASARLKGKTP
ncbi:hypothetical protein BST61_g3676 [Cercospora zeina]